MITQILLTPEDGKRLLARELMRREDIQKALFERTVVIIAGTTNAYVAEEALEMIGDKAPFNREAFVRGVTRPADRDRQIFPPAEDVVIEKGKRREGLTIFDIAPSLSRGDVILKGANAVHLATRTAGVLIGSDVGGTLMPCIAAAVGRRVRLIVPVGVEKRVEKPIAELCRLANRADAEGPRMCEVPGEIYTELEALAPFEPEIFSSGGTEGYEGICRLLVQCGDAREIRDFLKR
ncbi:MAG: hypothetical protein ACOYI8_10275 [Christensenellales bacterium]|jgi:hypothetical protein